ncbi:methyltransferase domain-containing protein [Trinickia fusca]|nr:methyltransferase domain-containing protein [Trinickia fusca]
MATVSILIPARKADYLGRALISAQQQTFGDIEILVGDDTHDAALAPIVSRIGDPRIRYFHHGFGDARRNAEALWSLAHGKYVKWLADDDLLMPTSVEVLVEALRLHPESALAFHARVLVDEDDAVVHTPTQIVNVGERALVDRNLLVAEMVGRMHNFVGEPSNVMINRERASAADLFTYRSLKLDYLGDVAMYLNLAERAPLVVVGGYWSMLRRHSEQASPATNPSYSAGLYEWELFVRGEAAAGSLSGAALAEAANRLRQHYAGFAGELPEIGRLLANIDELTARAPRELFDSERFRADFAHARASVEARVAQHARAGATAQRANQPIQPQAVQAAPGVTAQKVCSVCEQQVDAWLPYPHGVDRSFLDYIEPVGSTLERYLCPKCGCNDRERHLWLYIALSGLLERAPEMRILHIAPEHHIEPRVRRLAPLEYIVGDLYPSAPGHRRINAEQLDFPSGHFDLIICNHVLEHVDSPQAALAEFHRCLKPGGHLIAQTPYSPVLKYTFELTKAPSTQFATRYFGQNDHVRFFGANIADYFHAAGFSGELYPHSTALEGLDEHAWGVNAREPFFLFTKQDAAGGEVPRTVAAATASATSATVAPAGMPAAATATQAARAAGLAGKPIRLVCATRCAQENFLRDTALGRSLAVHRHANPPELLLFDKNSTGLPALYNAAIEQAASSPAILVFVHDDVSICDYFWTDRVREALGQFDVVGLAGNRRRSPLQPAWAFATPDFKWDTAEYLSGSVGHGKGFPSDEVSYFGPAGVECKLLDGLMMIADSERLIESGTRFDEQFDFHFYDMDFCRQAELKGLSMGTWPISVVHESAGAFNTPPWRAAYERYLRKYGH